MIKKIFNCISIHNGGGIIYLSLMHNQIDKKGNLILLDERARNKLRPFKNADIKFFKKNLFRNIFVLKERIIQTNTFKNSQKKIKNHFFQEYYLNGIPPFFRFSKETNKVYVLFQNRNLFFYLNYFNRRLFFSFNFIIYHILHSILINSFLKDTDYILVQTKTMKKILSSYKPKNRIFVQDNFWKDITLDAYLKNTNHKIKINNFDKKLIERIKNLSKFNKLFFYPASLDPHKNHKRLFKCFNKLSKLKYKELILLVTLEHSQLPKEIKNNKQIIFLGTKSFRVINQIYKLVDFLIFPSLNESLGLPLIEASLCNLPIIASDLDYVYDVSTPSYTFDPFSEEDIFKKILESAK